MKTRKVLSHTLLITELFQQVRISFLELWFRIFGLLVQINDNVNNRCENADFKNFVVQRICCYFAAQISNQTSWFEEENRESDWPGVSWKGQSQSSDLQLSRLDNFRTGNVILWTLLVILGGRVCYVEIPPPVSVENFSCTHYHVLFRSEHFQHAYVDGLTKTGIVYIHQGYQFVVTWSVGVCGGI